MKLDRVSNRTKVAIENIFPTIKEQGFVGRQLNPHLKEDRIMFQTLRYAYWVEKLKYLQNNDYYSRLEFDMYDDHSVHFGVQDYSKKLVGYVRLILPGKHGLQIQNEFESIIQPRIKTPRSLINSIESSRLIVESGIGAQRILVAQLLYKMQYRFAKLNNFKHWYNISEKKLIRALRLSGFPFSIIGDGKEYQGALCYPAYMSFNELERRLAAKHHSLYLWFNEEISKKEADSIDDNPYSYEKLKV